MRAVAITLAFWLASFGTAAAVIGDNDNQGGQPPVTTNDDRDEITVIVASDGDVVLGGDNGTPLCTYRKIRVGDLLPAEVEAQVQDDEASEFVRQVRNDDKKVYLYSQTCSIGQTTNVSFIFIEEVAPVDEVARAREELIQLVPPPNPTMSPDNNVNHLVGLPTWVWLAEADLAPISATVDIPGLSTTATATPSLIRLDPGDGSVPLECDNITTPYGPDLTSDDGCTHNFTHVSTTTASGKWDFTTALVWTVTWVNSAGEAGTADPIETETITPLEVIELQARTINS